MRQNIKNFIQNEIFEIDESNLFKYKNKYKIKDISH